ncbi:uracil phosphoribosyltransferase-domain-containing protein [Vararia minispora EC-137]|uniref:Uracil phosphoribosyltransferase-domain-containing protein n=1 Tax=Vararia minispora EC-137 TaxID=1314806 RepID=A0ACB8QQG2_9AGAM|nr:uracil phosphoribosyltransferase-domain-containing protein [Vararia minispora EC-137]
MSVTASNVHVCSSHPLINAVLSRLRLKSTSNKEFREGVRDLSLMIAYEASRSLEQTTFEGVSPISTFTGTVVKHRVGLTPILRAGLGMTDAILSLFPEAPVYHLGLYREKVSLNPVEYYCKLPANPDIDICYLLDPLIATGGTACAALQMILDWGVPLSNIKVLCILASEAGLKNVQAQYPGIEIWLAGVDPELTKDGLIKPGLGDTGDRLNNTQKP